MSAEIKIEHLNQYYGRKCALKDVNLTIHKGMFGLLGRNGAGKTTLMKVLATLLPKTEGSVSVCGIPVEDAARVRRITGYLPQEFSMYPNMTVYEAMDYLGRTVRAWKPETQRIDTKASVPGESPGGSKEKGKGIVRRNEAPAGDRTGYSPQSEGADRR